MANEFKNADFDAEFDTAYDVDTASGIITATLPNPAGNDGKAILFVNMDVNAILLGTYPIKGVSGFKITSPGDFVQIVVFEGEYILTSSSNYFTSATKSWKLTISDIGALVPTQTNV